MVSRKIAPRLEELVALELKHQAYLLPTHAARTQAELRALLAVARAAGRLATYLQTEVPADEWMPVDDTLARAYVRLERLASSRTPVPARRPGEEGAR
jgi:hypothetical protein